MAEKDDVDLPELSGGSAGSQDPQPLLEKQGAAAALKNFVKVLRLSVFVNWAVTEPDRLVSAPDVLSPFLQEAKDRIPTADSRTHRVNRG